MRYFANIIVYLTLLFAIVFAQQSPYATGEGGGGVTPYFRLGFSARALGMGEAFTGLADDYSAMVFNPAGLDQIEQMNISAFDMSFIVRDASYDFLSFIYPTVKIGTFGLAIGGFRSPEFGLRANGPIDIGKGYFGNLRAYLSYGYQIYQGIFIGATFKADYQSSDDLNRSDPNSSAVPTKLSGFGFGADLGFLYKNEKIPVLGEMSMGFNIVNILAPQIKVFSDPDSLPLMIRSGISKPLRFDENNAVNIAADIVFVPKYDKFDFHFGAEYRYLNAGAIRIGGKLVDEVFHPSFGIGMSYSNVSIDYSFGNQLDPNYESNGIDGASSLNSHRISIGYSFGQTRSEALEIEKLSLQERDSVLVEVAVSTDRAEQIQKNIESGLDYMGKEEWFNATVEFQQVISIDPFNREARAYFKQADSLLQKQYKQEQEEFARLQADSALARQDREYIDHHYNRGREFLKKNQFTEALFEFNAALERDPTNQIIIDARSSAQRRLDEEVNRLITEGRRQYRLGNYPEALRNLSEARVLLSEDNSLLQEIEQMSRSIQSQGDLNKGLQALEAGDFKTAAEIFKQALDTDPSNKDVEKYLKRAEGKANARKVVLTPANEKEYLEGVDLFLSGKYKDALTIWEKLLDKYPYSKKLIDAVETAEQRLKRTQSTVLEK